MATVEDYMTDPPLPQTGSIPIVNRPLWGFNYLGAGNYGYGRAPTNRLDAAAMRHDRAYDRFPGRSGPSLALLETELAEADARLAYEALLRSYSFNPLERSVARLTAVTFGYLAAIKYLRRAVTFLVNRLR
jgi:hypothetical protein